MSSDSLGAPTPVPADNSTAVASVDPVAALVASYGVEVILLDKTFNTSYNLFVRNTRAKIAMEETGATVTAYSSSGSLRVHLPSSSGTADEHVVYDVPPDRSLMRGNWLKAWRNIRQSMFVRMLCIDSSGSSPVLHQCQRYYDKTGWSYAKNYERCPPALEICDASSNTTWKCNDNLVGAAHKCPTGGAASMSFCEEGKFCRNTGVDSITDTLPSGMCTDGVETVPL